MKVPMPVENCSPLLRFVNDQTLSVHPPKHAREPVHDTRLITD